MNYTIVVLKVLSWHFYTHCGAVQVEQDAPNGVIIHFHNVLVQLFIEEPS